MGIMFVVDSEDAYSKISTCINNHLQSSKIPQSLKCEMHDYWNHVVINALRCPVSRNLCSVHLEHQSLT